MGQVGSVGLHESASIGQPARLIGIGLLLRLIVRKVVPARPSDASYLWEVGRS